MKERPILFSGPMVRAILEGRKTVTRRLIKPQPTVTEAYLREHKAWVEGLTLSDYVNNAWRSGFIDEDCPYGETGDRLWVREAWATDAQVNSIAPRELSQGEPILYLADGSGRQTGCAMISPGKGRPSIHMPSWACRILLEITDVRIERLQDITEEQAEAEGVQRPETITDVDVWDGAERELFNAMNQPRARFRRLWGDINGPHSWDANPWVWVVEFKRVAP